MRSAVLAAVLAVGAEASVPADFVARLPGYASPLPSKLYSGYLASNPGKHSHYMFSESLRAPSKDPIVLWFNGGPGCSSMEGAMSESGMYRINEFSDPPTLSFNNYTWNKISNNLYFEAPAGVGFSYCDTASGCSHTDTSTANDNLATLLSFYTAYPEYASNELWIAGESYAGIYVPSLAYAVYNHNQAKPAAAINLKGILVGNGCVGKDVGHCGNDPTGLSDYHDLQTWRGHGLISETIYDACLKTCVWDNESAECSDNLQKAANEIGDIDVYYLYNTCSDPAITRRAPVPSRSMLARVQAARAARGLPALKGGLDPNCFGTGPTLEAWSNQPEVKAALHVSADIDWALCSNNGTFQYSPDISDERAVIYPTLTEKAGYQVLVFNGEADLCVPYTDNEWWTRTMNYTTERAWHAWSVQGEEGPYVGGYAIKYANNFTFATVRGAGHMVSETRPEAGYALFEKHVTGAGF